jgi:LytS/YehU family sensor histidine kinase
MYIVFASIAVYKSIIIDNSIAPITYLTIGIFVESFVFMSTLALKIKYLYDEKIQAQKEIINEKTKIFQLKEAYQNELENKLASQEKVLRTTLEKSEKEKINHLKSKYENEILNLKLDALRSQMNPHFIFNALNSIKVYFIENNKEKAVYYLNKFSKLIRNILEFSKREYITVKEELEVIELYLTIENIRFDNTISVIFEPLDDPEITEKRIPGLILQPFVENSIWHGLMLKEGHKEITIGCEKKGDKIGLYIQDNGIGREKAKENKMNSFKKDSLGIEFSHERLKNFNLQNNLTYTFEIIDLQDQNKNSTGTKVIFWLM